MHIYTDELHVWCYLGTFIEPEIPQGLAMIRVDLTDFPS